MTAEVTADGLSFASEGEWARRTRRFFARRTAMPSLVVLGLVLLFALAGPLITPNTYDGIDWDMIGVAPTLANSHWFGTDFVGRDLFVRTAYGARISLLVGLIATAVALLIGVLYGAVAGYLGGALDNLMMRFVDVLYSLPFIFMVILLMAVFGRSFVLVLIAIGAVEWLTIARIVRAQTLALKGRDFVLAARVCGATHATIVRRHVLPHVAGTVVVYASLTIPEAIMAESFLSFLGLGIQEPMTSWGSLIADGATEIETMPWMLIFPSLFLTLTLLALNFVGDSMRDAFDEASA